MEPSKTNVVKEVFGWNPFYTNEHRDHVTQELPEWAKVNHEIAQLTDLYQQQLAELAGAHSLLLEDQERYKELLAPYTESDGGLKEPLGETLLLLKKGLDLRLKEFEEDCRRIQRTERKLQRRIEDCTLNYETSLVEAKGYAESRLLEQINQQQKMIQCQQIELDELRFQRDLYSDEALRLRQLCRYGNFVSNEAKVVPQRDMKAVSPRLLHQEYAGSKLPFAWMRQIRFGHKDRKREKYRRKTLKDFDQPSTSNQSPDVPFSTKTKKNVSVSPSKTIRVSKQTTCISNDPSEQRKRVSVGKSIRNIEKHDTNTHDEDKKKSIIALRKSLPSTSKLRNRSVQEESENVEERENYEESDEDPQSIEENLQFVEGKSSTVVTEPEVAEQEVIDNSEIKESLSQAENAERNVHKDISGLKDQFLDFEGETYEKGTSGKINVGYTEKNYYADKQSSSEAVSPMQKVPSFGGGIPIGSRRITMSKSSMASSSVLSSPMLKKTVAFPRPTTLSRLTSQSPITREQASRFFK